MSILAPFLIRILGPVLVLAYAATLLAPAMRQPSTLYVNTNVVQMVGGQAWPTLLLIALAVSIATAIWLPLAVLTARRGYHAGLTMTPVSVLAQAMAPFWIAIVSLLLFSTPSRLLPAAGGGTVAHAILPASALAIVLLGFLAHATYLRAVSRQSLEAESGAAGPDADTLRLEIAEDWLDTIGRQAGMLVGALMLIETVFNWPGLGRLFVNGLRNADAPFRSIALFDLLIVSFALTVLFGIGAELVRVRLHRLQAAAPAPRSAAPARFSDGGVWDPRPMAPSEPRWLAVLTVVLGGLILVMLLILTTSTAGHAVAAQGDVPFLPPGSAGHTFGTDALGRDMHARIATGVRTGFQTVVGQGFFALLCGVPLGLLAARLGRVVEGATSILIDGVLMVPALVLVIGDGLLAGGPNYMHMLTTALVLVFARFTRDAVRAVWSGERRDAQAAFGAMLMGLLVGLSFAVLLEASLSFLGVKMPPLGMSLGEMLATGSLTVARAPWLSVYPGIALTALASSLILIGYGTLGLLRSRPAAAMPAEERRRLAEA